MRGQVGAPVSRRRLVSKGKRMKVKPRLMYVVWLLCRSLWAAVLWRLHGCGLYVVCAMVDALREVAQALAQLLPFGRGEASCASVAVDAVELVVEP